MAQTTAGIRSILSLPQGYDLLQKIMGGDSLQRRLVADTIRPLANETILDIGCGTANIAKFLPQDTTYIGFDISEQYIRQCRKRFPHRGPFFARIFTAAELPALPRFDIVIATSLLHHLDDAEAVELFRLTRKALKPGGRFVTMDPCLTTPQNPIARFLIERDRGLNVRRPAAYEELARQVYQDVQVVVRHRSWIPYTHCFMVSTAT